MLKNAVTLGLRPESKSENENSEPADGKREQGRYFAGRVR